MVEYLRKENKEFGLKVQNVVVLPEDQDAEDFISWATRQRLVFTYTTTLDVSIGIHGYEVVIGKLAKRIASEYSNSHNRSLQNGLSGEDVHHAY